MSQFLLVCTCILAAQTLASIGLRDCKKGILNISCVFLQVSNWNCGLTVKLIPIAIQRRLGLKIIQRYLSFSRKDSVEAVFMSELIVRLTAFDNDSSRGKAKYIFLMTNMEDITEAWAQSGFVPNFSIFAKVARKQDR